MEEDQDFLGKGMAYTKALGQRKCEEQELSKAEDRV